MVWMGFGTGLLLSIYIKTEILPAPLAEFKEMTVKDRTTYLAVMALHSRRLKA
jgi:hypothetical protein